MLEFREIVISVICTVGFSVYAQEVKELEVIRYTAGDSIPIGNNYDKNINNNETKRVEVKRYTAGQSIPIGDSYEKSRSDSEVSRIEVKRYTSGQSIPISNGYEKVINNSETKRVEVKRYTAGQSIPIMYKDSSDNILNKSKIIKQHSEEKSKIIPESSYLPLAAALGDSVSTYIGVNTLGLKEANGLISTSTAGLVGLFVIKAGMTYYFDNQKPSIRKAGLKGTTGVWSGVTMNNLLLIAGASNPVSLVGGVLFGAYMYKKEGEVLDRELISIK